MLFMQDNFYLTMATGFIEDGPLQHQFSLSARTPGVKEKLFSLKGFDTEINNTWSIGKATIITKLLATHKETSTLQTIFQPVSKLQQW